MQGVALGTTTPVQWKQMGAAIVAGVEAGWVNPVINKVRERPPPRHGCMCANILCMYIVDNNNNNNNQEDFLTKEKFKKKNKSLSQTIPRRFVIFLI